ncbi:FecR domain-containing protein [Pedobacter sp. JY14-1]|uniref:FecR family protein n=1 Tax=Pedobacter sp. JY14-1 TaxID=3034151 RepID=UPI0023E09B96|nr:FecR domain-containing protein [Pedobacter sp. JY14-1]
MEAKAFKDLLNRYREGKTSAAENAQLESWYWQLDAAALREKDFSDALSGHNLSGELSEVDLLRARDSIAARLGLDIGVPDEETASLETTEMGELTKPRKSKPRKLKLWRNAGAVAAAVATIVFGVWFFNSRFDSSRHSEDTRNLLNTANDLAPGKYGATITLANGQVIQLDSSKKGVVVGKELKYDDGSSLRAGEAARQSPYEIASEAAQPRNDGKEHTNVMMMLTATTAKGQTYSFTLPDGTKVWLNADSKLEFPAQFSGKERRILMQGEAYFVVKHNAKQPFRVVSRTGSGREQMVEDIGTEFNINAYADELSVRTTLVEGSAAVYSITQARHSDDRRNLLSGKDKGSLAALEMTGKTGKSVVLTPNQQSAFYNGNISVKKVDVNEAIGWKNGKFTFNKTSLEEVLRQLGRWYDVDIVYPDGIPDRQFTGEIYRNLNASEALELLKFTKVSFRIAGKQIIVNK